MIDKSKLYDLIYAKADKLLKQFNPCNIHIDTDSSIKCNNSDRYNTIELCCCGCKYWDNGCTIKCLGCKIGLCTCWDRYFISNEIFEHFCLVVNVHREFYVKMYKLIRIADKYNLIKLRSPKENMFNKEYQYV